MHDQLSDDILPAIRVAALYHFTHIDDPASLRDRLRKKCEVLGIRGTLLLAAEGMNGTISGAVDNVERLLAELRGLPGCAGLDVKYSGAREHPFARMKVKLKPEIVTMGVEGIDAARDAGTHVDPEEWNALLARPDLILIDTRNDYEVELGTFAGALNPNIRNFREFPAWFSDLKERLRENGQSAPPIAMFCTGGIRCEKSTAFARSVGCQEVYHLKGGILRYLEEIPAENSLWRGNCFVFDERVSVGQDLALTDDRMCRQCGRPHPFGTGHDCPPSGSRGME